MTTYAQLENLRVDSGDGLRFAYRDTGGDGRPVVLFQHFRGNLDNWDPALIDDLAAMRRVITFDYEGVGASEGSIAHTIAETAEGSLQFLDAMNLEEADVLSDSIVVMDKGRIIASGTAEDLKRRVGLGYCTVSPVNPADLSKIFDVVADLDGAEVDYEANTVSVHSPDGVATLAEVFRRVDRLGVELLDIALRKPSLDEAFLHLTESVTT